MCDDLGAGRAQSRRRSVDFFSRPGHLPRFVGHAVLMSRLIRLYAPPSLSAL